MATECVNRDRNKEHCTCTVTDCPNHGICCDCLAGHLGKESFPSCVRTKIKESPAFRDYVANLLSQEA